MKTVCILYGFCEGPRVSKRFRLMLEQAGHKVVADPTAADIIIGHSGGCFLLPEQVRAEHIIQIGIVHWPGRSVAASLTHKLVTDLKNHHRHGALRFWARKTFWNFFYFWNIPATIRMLVGRKNGYHWLYGSTTTVIRPNLDSFCTPSLELLPFIDKPNIIHIPGQHDDCWREPEAYIAVVQSGYGKRILATPRGKKTVVPGIGVESAREPQPSR